MSYSTPMDQSQRKSKQQATKNIYEQAHKRPLQEDDKPSYPNDFPVAIYGIPEDHGDFPIPQVTRAREAITNGLLKTVSEMYFATTDPYAEILRCLDDRIDPTTRKYVSGLETLLKNEVLDANNSRPKLNKEKVIITPLDMLACPFRQREVLDQWTPIDTALFELAICQHKGFHAKKVAQVFGDRKSVEELSAFFDKVYSRSDNWKKIQKLIKNEMQIDEDELESVKNHDDGVIPTEATGQQS